MNEENLPVAKFRRVETERDVVLAAVRQNGAALENASVGLKDDRAVVLAAVAQNGMALDYASDKLKEDREVVLAAVAQDGFTLQYLSVGLKADREVVLAAIDQNRRAVRYASDKLWGNETFRQEFAKRLPYKLLVPDKYRGSIRDFHSLNVSSKKPVIINEDVFRHIKGFIGGSRKRKTKRMRKVTLKKALENI